MVPRLCHQVPITRTISPREKEGEKDEDVSSSSPSSPTPTAGPAEVGVWRGEVTRPSSSPERTAEVDPSDGRGRGGNDNTYGEAEVHPPARVFDKGTGRRCDVGGGKIVGLCCGGTNVSEVRDKKKHKHHI